MVQHIRYALRQLRRTPVFTLTVVLTLALGIGANAAIFSVIDAVLLKPLGYQDADRIVSINTRFLLESRNIPRLGGDDYNDLAAIPKSFEATAHYQTGEDGLQLAGRSIYTHMAFVSPLFGKVLGISPAEGRFFTNSKEAEQEILISPTFAQENFGSVHAALNQVVHYDGKPRTIVGILPANLSFPDNASVWIGQDPRPATANRTAYNQRAIARMKPGVTLEAANAELATFSAQLQAAYLEDKNKAILALPLQEQLVGAIRPMLRLIMGAVAVILLIVCANIGHLQLVRATRMQHQVALQTALGAGRANLALRAMLQATLLALGGALAGILLAIPLLKLILALAPPNLPRLNEIHLNGDVFAFCFGLSLLTMLLTAVLPVWRSWHVDPATALKQDSSRGLVGESHTLPLLKLILALAPPNLPRLNEIHLNGDVFAFCFGLSLLTMLLTAVLPVWRSWHVDPATALKQDSSRGLVGESHTLRSTLVIGEIALTFVLSVAAILLVQQMVRLSHTTPGFETDHLLVVDSHAPGPSKEEAKTDPEAVSRRLDALIAQVQQIPGVDSAAGVRGIPMGGGNSSVGYAIRGRSVFKPPFKDLPNSDIIPVTPAYFTTMRIPLLRGRLLNASDTLSNELVLVITRSLADQQFKGQDPIGQQMMCGFDDGLRWETIVGVVDDILQNSPADKPAPMFYVPIAQHPGVASDVSIAIRTHGAPGTYGHTVEQAIQTINPSIATTSKTMREQMGASLRAQRFQMALFSSFAFISILLAAIGMYGVTAYTVAQRRFEFALRFAFGADRTQVFTMVLHSAGVLSAIGLAAGTILAYAATRLLGSLLTGVKLLDATSWLTAAGLIVLISLAATLIPARRAAATSPMEALRTE